MQFREHVAYFANELKKEKQYSYSDLESLTGLTRKQISCILKGSSGVSVDKIEQFFSDAFDTELEVIIVQKITDFE